METTRRMFLGVTATAMVYAGSTQVRAAKPVALHASDGELVYVGGTRDPVRVKLAAADTATFGCIAQEMAPGSIIPVHLHENEDELIFIQGGEGEARLGDARIPIRAGSLLFVPRGTWHAGQNTGTSVMHWLAIYSPSGFEGYFLEIGSRTKDGAPPRLTMEQMQALDQKYGIRYLR